MTSWQRLWLWLADLVLIIHTIFCGFVVVGLVLVWLGWFRKWSFIRNFWFRVGHLACIGLVVAESWLGVVCPLTVWENRLRRLAGGHECYAGSFIQAWFQRLIFFDLDERVFTVLYSVFFVAVALSFWRVPPRWPRRNPVPEKFPNNPAQNKYR